MNIYWSKAPEGATHYSPECNKNYQAWWKKDGDEMHCICDKGGIYIWENGHFDDTVKLIPRPTEPQWQNGLPPVGVECERLCIDEWIHVYIAGKTKGGKFILERMNRDIEIISDGEFRPLRTQAETERERMALSLWKAVHKRSTATNEEILERGRNFDNCLEAIDAGWRPTK